MNTSACRPRLIVVPLIALAIATLCGCGNAQSRKAAYLQHGKDYLAAGNFDKARVEFRNAGQIDPKDAEVHYLLGQIAERTNNVRDAYAQYNTAVTTDPNLVEARAALGRIYLYVGMPDKAIEDVEVGLAKDPNSAQLLTVRGGARSQRGDVKGALEDAVKANSLAPDDEYTISLLASAYRRNGSLDKAIDLVSKAIERHPQGTDYRTVLADLELANNQAPEAERQLRKIVELEPKVLAHRVTLVKFYLQQKNTAAAESAMRAAADSAPDNNAAKVQLIELLASLHGKSAAEEQATKFIAADPKNDTLNLAIAEVLMRLGDGQQAEQMLVGVVSRSGTHAEGLAARDRLASMLIERKDTAGATKLVGEVLANNPRDNDALLLRSNMALARGDTRSAITDLRSVLRDQPNSLPVLQNLAGAYQQGGEFGQAEEVLRTAMSVAPRDVNTQVDLAKVLSGEGKHDQADQLLAELSAASPNSVPILDLLFREQVSQKKLDEAAETAGKLQKLTPDKGLGYYYAGLVAEERKNLSEARKDYTAALDRQPQASEPLAALVKLDELDKHPEAASARLESVIKKFPADPVARAIQGDLQLTLQKPAEAAATFSAARDLAPSWPRAYIGLALAQQMQKQDDEAIRTLRAGLEKTSDDIAIAASLSGLLVKLNRASEAMDLYEAMLARKPDSIQAANNLAMLIVTYKKDSASLARAQKLAELLATSSQASMVDTRGWVKFKSGDYHAAESLLQQAVVGAPEAPEFRYHLAMAQLKSGESQAATQNLETALKSPRSFAGMDEAKAALAELKKGSAVG